MQNINIQASIIEATAQGNAEDTARLTELLTAELEAAYPEATITAEEAPSTLTTEELEPHMEAALSKF